MFRIFGIKRSKNTTKITQITKNATTREGGKEIESTEQSDKKKTRKTCTIYRDNMKIQRKNKFYRNLCLNLVNLCLFSSNSNNKQEWKHDRKNWAEQKQRWNIYMVINFMYFWWFSRFSAVIIGEPLTTLHFTKSIKDERIWLFDYICCCLRESIRQWCYCLRWPAHSIRFGAAILYIIV